MKKLILTIAAVMTMSFGFAQSDKPLQQMTHDQASTYMQSNLNLNSTQTAKVKELNKDYAALFSNTNKQQLTEAQKKSAKVAYDKKMKAILSDEQYAKYEKMPYKKSSTTKKTATKKTTAKKTVKKTTTKKAAVPQKEPAPKK